MCISNRSRQRGQPTRQPTACTAATPDASSPIRHTRNSSSGPRTTANCRAHPVGSSSSGNRFPLASAPRRDPPPAPHADAARAEQAKKASALPLSAAGAKIIGGGPGGLLPELVRDHRASDARTASVRSRRSRRQPDGTPFPPGEPPARGRRTPKRQICPPCAVRGVAAHHPRIIATPHRPRNPLAPPSRSTIVTVGPAAAQMRLPKKAGCVRCEAATRLRHLYHL
jgi:hypothetical protein